VEAFEAVGTSSRVMLDDDGKRLLSLVLHGWLHQATVDGLLAGNPRFSAARRLRPIPDRLNRPNRVEHLRAHSASLRFGSMLRMRSRCRSTPARNSSPSCQVGIAVRKAAGSAASPSSSRRRNRKP